jgi:hypothetical protein
VPLWKGLLSASVHLLPVIPVPTVSCIPHLRASSSACPQYAVVVFWLPQIRASPHRHRRPIHHRPQHKTGMHATHPLDAGDLVEQQLLVGVHIPHDHLELVVRLLAGDQQAFQHLRQGGDAGFEVFEALRGVAVHGDIDEGHQGEAQFLGIHHCAVTGDDARLFQGLDPAQAGRGGEADAVGQLLIAQAALLLQDFQNALIVAIHSCSIASIHH